MNYKVELTPLFVKEAKKLSKKYPSFKKEIKELISLLEENPDAGKDLGNGVFKIRIAIGSKNKGKSGGARIIYLFQIHNDTIILLSIYNKGEKDTITDKEIKKLLEDLENE